MTYKLEDYRSLLREQKQHLTYDGLAFLTGVNKYYFWMILHNEAYYPPDWVCIKLKIATRMLAPVCSVCGEVHTTKTCTKNRKPRRPLTPWLNETEVDARIRYLQALFQESAL